MRKISGRIIWLTGNSGAGKTTIAKAYQGEYDSHCIILDGDEMRQSISLGTGFSKEAREEHNLRVARLAWVLATQGHTVLVTVIAPFRSTREAINRLTSNHVEWVYIHRTIIHKDYRPYEEPAQEKGLIDVDSCIDVVYNAEKLRDLIE